MPRTPEPKELIPSLDDNRIYTTYVKRNEHSGKGLQEALNSVVDAKPTTLEDGIDALTEALISYRKAQDDTYSPGSRTYKVHAEVEKMIEYMSRRRGAEKPETLFVTGRAHDLVTQIIAMEKEQDDEAWIQDEVRQIIPSSYTVPQYKEVAREFLHWSKGWAEDNDTNEANIVALSNKTALVENMSQFLYNRMSTNPNYYRSRITEDTSRILDP